MSSTVTVVLKRGRAKPLWHGHPWVYSEAVARVEGDVEPGGVVDVHDFEGRFIGRGFLNPRSQIRVRVATRSDEALDGAWVRRRVADAVALRKRLGLPSAETDAYRLLNSEGDGVPGLIADVYRDACSLQFTGLGMKRLEAEVIAAIQEALSIATIYEVPAGGVAGIEGFTATPRIVAGRPRHQVECRENGIELVIEPLGGQKTGAFLDQRENRATIGRVARGAAVLDCYTYLGGFALNALKGGAESAVAVDISRRALDAAIQNADRSGLGGKLRTAESDVFRFLEGAPERSFDLVIVDPPKFAASKKDLESATRGYRRLNALALRAAAPGALFASSSCSQLVDAERFERILASAALDAGRAITVVGLGSQGPDHPVPPGFPEGRYLKFLLCRVI